MEYIDSYLSVAWNNSNRSEKIVEENFWDFCRELEKGGFLVGDDASISAISIGPFKIVSMIEVKRKDLLLFFLETIIPAIFSKTNDLPFDQVYSLYLLPAVNLFIKLADECYWVKDLLQWEILMFIREENKINIYPTTNEIKKNDTFHGIEEWQMDDAIQELKEFKNLLGDKQSLILEDFEGRIESLV